MFIVEVTLALILALLVALFFGPVLGRRGPWGSIFLVFLVVFLGALAAALWVEPTGPEVMGISWIPMFFVALLLALLLASSTPAGEVTERPDAAEEEQRTRQLAALGIFFWGLLLSLAAVVALGVVL